MNSQKIDGKEKASKRFKVFNHLVHAVKSTVSWTFMLVVARHFLFIFFLSSVNSISKLDWLFQYNTIQYFIQEKENKNCKSISRKGIF